MTELIVLDMVLSMAHIMLLKCPATRCWTTDWSRCVNANCLSNINTCIKCACDEHNGHVLYMYTGSSVI